MVNHEFIIFYLKLSLNGKLLEAGPLGDGMVFLQTDTFLLWTAQAMLWTLQGEGPHTLVPGWRYIWA